MVTPLLVQHPAKDMLQYARMPIGKTWSFLRIAAYTCIAVFALLLIGNWDYFFVPDPDIFEYIDSGKWYLRLQVPDRVQVPPLYAILIALLSPVFTSLQHPEIFSAHLINISAAVVSLILVYSLLSKYSTYLALFVVVALCTNPVFFFQSLNVNTEVPFLAAAVVAFTLYQRGWYGWAYTVAGGSFLIRYEGALVVLSLLLVDILGKKGPVKIIRQAAMGIGLCVLWLMVAHSHTSGGNIFGNAYIQEVLQFRSQIPNVELITRIPALLFDQCRNSDNGSSYPLCSGALYLLTASGAIALFAFGGKTYTGIFVFSSLYLLFHILFPFSADRYAYPLLWVFYASILAAFRVIPWVKKSQIWKLLGGILYAYMGITNALGIYESMRHTAIAQSAYPRHVRYEFRLAAQWLSIRKFPTPVIVITPEPWIMKYFTTNPDVSYLYAPYGVWQNCNTIGCIIRDQRSAIGGKRILYVQQSYHYFGNDADPSQTNFNVKMLRGLPGRAEAKDFTLLEYLEYHDVWAKIYEYRTQ
jgi:hypothetical protein